LEIAQADFRVGRQRPDPLLQAFEWLGPARVPCSVREKNQATLFHLVSPRYAIRLSTNRHSFLVRITPPHYAGGWTTLIRPMYRYDHHDQRLVDERVAQFRDQTRRFLAGELTEDEFRPLRLRNGLYI